jgi:putative PIN family toxin of toxin-antitoxin system
MRVVFDTNVLVAALRSKTGAAFELVSMIPSPKFELALSLPLYMEYRDVLLRPNVKPIGVSDSDIEDFIDNILTNAKTRNIHYLWRHSLRDENDEMLLEIAVASQAEYIVTFNVRDFANIEFFGIECIRPGNFLNLVRNL